MALTRREPRRKSLKSFAILEQICLMRAWRPGIEGTRWETWTEFLADADAVHDELLSDPTIRRVYGDLEPFAVRLRRDLGPGQVYDSHNHPRSVYPALWHSHIFTPGDDHCHDDDGGREDGVGDVPPTGRRVPVLA